jgi:hypothetical protein
MGFCFIKTQHTRHFLALLLHRLQICVGGSGESGCRKLLQTGDKLGLETIFPPHPTQADMEIETGGCSD